MHAGAHGYRLTPNIKTSQSSKVDFRLIGHFDHNGMLVSQFENLKRHFRWH